MMDYDFVIVGGGIVGLSVGMEVSKRYPNAKVLIVEKERALSLHQTGRNSGVIHSGIYYKPGSLKAQLARKGNEQMINFCKENDIPYKICGKVIVAVKEDELALLDNLYNRGVQNQLVVKKISMKHLNKIEPYVKGIAAILVPSTGIVSYQQVSTVFAKLIQQNGGEISLDTEVQNITSNDKSVEIKTNKGIIQSRFLINCAGLLSDRIAKMSDVKSNMRIIPFRGEYYELKPEKQHLVKNLVYPVPNPNFPFLGVHFTKMIDGRVLIGPNAILSFKREGYKKMDFRLKDFVETVTYPGLVKLASQNLSEGMKEIIRSYSKNALIKEVKKYFPDIQKNDIQPAKSGVRAQALNNQGELLDDFVIIQDKQTIHVCNAPSPAATASIEIGKWIIDYWEKVNKNVKVN